MKLHTLKVTNFRAIDNVGLDFTDNLSRPRAVTLIVGPNGSGKTSILDAIHVVVRTMEDYQNPRLRDGLEFSPLQLVRGRTSAKIEFEYSIDKDEALAIGEIFDSLEGLGAPPFRNKQDMEPPYSLPTTCTWTYPKSPSSSRGKPYSIYSTPRNSAKVLGARGQTAQAVANGSMSHSYFERIGGVCYLDQRRSFRIAKKFQAHDIEKIPHDDVLSWIYNYYLKHITWNEKEYGESYWSKIQRLFNEICSPAELIGPESGPDITTLILKKNNIEYDLSQMSSGEHQILRLIVGLVAETARNSIVLIDEVELHLHPAWQRKLIRVLRKEDMNNQYIFTTHSPFIRELFFEDEILELGDLDNE
jgi:predicted ATPase